MAVGNVPRQQNRENNISAEKVSHFQQWLAFVELISQSDPVQDAPDFRMAGQRLYVTH